MDWLGCFGKVISEITEEQFGADEQVPDPDPELPPIGNGTYIDRVPYFH